jgi:DNA repair protein SbcC/Rad50
MNMLGWIFKKKLKAQAAAPAAALKSAAPVAAPAAPAVDWTARLAQAHGDDDALLALLRTAGAPLNCKQAAVEALRGEAALQQAELEFRRHDRRVHQLAKRRLLAAVAQRQTREQATRLIETARSLSGEAEVAVNLGVELDHAWQALDAGAIDPAQHDEFAALTAQLTAQVRRRADQDQQRKRRQADTLQALQTLQAACAEAAAGTQDRAGLAAAVALARDTVAACLSDDAAAPGRPGALAGLQHALQTAALLDDRLAVLDRLLAGPAEAVPSVAAAPAADPAEAAPATADADAPTGPESVALAPTVDDPQRAWQAFAPLPDLPLAALLQARHARWQQAQDQARQERMSQRRVQAQAQQRAHQGAQGAALADRVAQAEAALDAGQWADAQRQLSDIDEALPHPEVADALRSRIAAAQARLAQLRGWQHWADGRARDELVLQAEALAAATAADGVGKDGSEHANEGEGEGPAAGELDADVARLSIRQRGELIDSLRSRWKEIDRLGGGAGTRALWLRFDAALTAAHAPVAAHAAALRAARDNNLAARHLLLDALDAAGQAASGGPAESATPVVATDEARPADATTETPAAAPTDARALASALDRFQAEWRKLGPLEHTVPRTRRAALVERMDSTVRRLEAPLQAARRQARSQREALVARAHALAGDGPGRGRDLAGEARALQAEWQQHAKALPLARADEQALWTDFKAAIDAAFAAREAVFSARDAEFEAHAAERVALIERLQLRPADSPATQRRTLAEVDTAWQRCGPAPRARAASLDAQYRAAREALQQWLNDSTQRAWLATCDALEAKLALCLAREQGDGVDAAAFDTAWQALRALPPRWEDTLQRRAGAAVAAGAAGADGTASAPAVDDLLLQIEIAWELPTPTAFEAARRERKLLAMKLALEGRRAAVPEAIPADAAMAQLLGRSGLDDGQRERLAAALAAWRRRGPQALAQ